MATPSLPPTLNSPICLITLITLPEMMLIQTGDSDFSLVQYKTMPERIRDANYHKEEIVRWALKLKDWDDQLIAQYPYLRNLLRNMEPAGWGKEAMDDVRQTLNTFTTPHQKSRRQRIQAIIRGHGQMLSQ